LAANPAWPASWPAGFTRCSASPRDLRYYFSAGGLVWLGTIKLTGPLRFSLISPEPWPFSAKIVLFVARRGIAGVLDMPIPEQTIVKSAALKS